MDYYLNFPVIIIMQLKMIVDVRKRKTRRNSKTVERFDEFATYSMGTLAAPSSLSWIHNAKVA